MYDFDPNINKIHFMFCTEVKDFKEVPKSGYELLEGEDLVMFDYRKDNETKLFVPIKTGADFTNS